MQLVIPQSKPLMEILTRLVCSSNQPRFTRFKKLVLLSFDHAFIAPLTWVSRFALFGGGSSPPRDFDSSTKALNARALVEVTLSRATRVSAILRWPHVSEAISFIQAVKFTDELSRDLRKGWHRDWHF